MRLRLVGLLALLGCTSGPPDVRAVVVPGATPRELAFRLEARRADAPAQVGQLVVASSRRSGGRVAQASGSPVYWAILHRSDAPPLELPVTIAYGQAPLGFAVARRPTALPLPPGLYELDVRTAHGHTVTYFRIGTDGRVE